jgi:hypothetical protein
VAMTLLYGGLVAPPAAQAGGAGSLATNFVGRSYFNPTTLQGFVVGPQTRQPPPRRSYAVIMQLRRSGTESSLTLRWREMDSNHRSLVQ